MANTTGGDRIQKTSWQSARVLRLPATPPATSTIFYAAQAVGRDINGNMIQCDDTQRLEFIGFTNDFIRTQVDPIDTVQQNGILGDKEFDVDQPLLFIALIASATAGDEGRKVYWQFNNQVQYSPGNNGNFAGYVQQVVDPTHVCVVPPWLARVNGATMQSNMILAGTGAITLTKWDVNRTFQLPSTGAQTVTLPPLLKTSPGDRITFLQTGTGAFQVTLAGSGTDNINGANTSTALGTAQFSKLTVESDGGLQTGTKGWVIVA